MLSFKETFPYFALFSKSGIVLHFLILFLGDEAGVKSISGYIATLTQTDVQ